MRANGGCQRGLRATRARRRVAEIAALILVLWSLSGCSLGYITTSAWRQAKIIWGRTPLTDALNSAELSTEQRELLSRVPAVLDFADSQLGLNIGDAYTSYYHLDQGALSWIVLGSRRDKFELYTWWFPIVGSVPYKGFLDEADAWDAANTLQADGYETWVRPAGAFSTLGWFNDPVVSSMLEHGEPALVNTLIHELTHRTFWIPNNVAFNETAANVIGTLGAVEFFDTSLQRCQMPPPITVLSAPALTSCAAIQVQLTAACKEFSAQRKLATALDELYNELDALYLRAPASVLADRDVVFAAWRAKYPAIAGRWTMLNNARLMQARLYYTRFNEISRIAQAVTLPEMVRQLRDVLDPKTWTEKQLEQIAANHKSQDESYGIFCR